MHSIRTAARYLPALASLVLLAACTNPSRPANEVRLAIAQIDRGVLIWLPEKLLFAPGQTEIDVPLAAPCLARISQLLSEKSGYPVSLESHTDSFGETSELQTFSHIRARNLRQALLARGLPAERLNALGYGDTRPLAPNDTAAGRQLNRRIELIILGETVEHFSRNETSTAFEAAFDKLRRLLDQALGTG